ncbi:unnamed protein product [Calypogeia fissa]
MLEASSPSVLMKSTAVWASGSHPSVLSTNLNRVNPGGQHLRGKGLQLSNLPLWSFLTSRPLPPLGASLRASGMDVDGDTPGRALSHEAGDFQSQLSTSTVENGEAAGVAENELSVFSKFIDEQLLQILNEKTENPVRQTVLMTDGTDTRPYCLLWPSPSVIFDVSPEAAFKATSRKQIEKGLKVPRSCLLQHVSVDLVQQDLGDDFVDSMVGKGYRGDAPSVWVMEMPIAKLSELCLQEILALASSLLMKGSTFLGVLSCPWVGSSEETRALLERLFVGHGFTLKVRSYEDLTLTSSMEGTGVLLASPPNLRFAFIALQQRLSDAQVEYGRMQIALAEEVEEDGFEDNW